MPAQGAEPRQAENQGEIRTETNSMAVASPSSAPETMGDTLAAVAKRHELPADFFIRLIWQESRFNPSAVSFNGAQGIAQFMPGTARQRGLEDSFDPGRAIPKSAELLRDLNREFGNLGLATAAYNAGSGRCTIGSPAVSRCPAKRSPTFASSPAAPPRNG